MKTSVLAVATALVTGLGLGPSAFAADMALKAPPPSAPIWTWTGWYVGATAGGDWGRDPVTSLFTCPDAACAYIIPANLAVVSAAGTGTLKGSGFTGGIELGYNAQFGNFVLGAETDFESFRVAATRVVTGPFPAAVTNFTVGTSVSTSWLWTLRGRAGFALAPQVLVYGTGGLAVTQARLSNSFTDNFAALGGAANTAGASSTSGTWAGYVVGGGVEWGIAPHWTVKGEYLYVNFGSKTTTAIAGGLPGFTPNTLTTTGTLSANIARAGVNYKF
jgi:outer membrane immunogenic protein